MVKTYPNVLTDPKTKRTILLKSYLSRRKRAKVYFDPTYIKYFIKEELEEMLRTHRGRQV